ncbi:MFS transporter [Catenovulum sp. 2E275]|uniref:MFS transporter n=1 Tax=Catenovulum sp. 2E275 TaxID=2980497 RepID=UPI0021D237C8|nr:MFS transporter [Catenovulum sp. 2E275]MCU4674804.1 MFS transporter [Catenovulum sp. 2E275]
MQSLINSNKARLSQVYFAYFTILGIISNYLGLYLHSLSLPPSLIGVVLAVMTVGRVAGPGIWANLKIFKHSPEKNIQLGCLFALLSFSLIFLFGHQHWVLLISLGGFAFFWSAVMPQLEAITQFILKGDSTAYSYVRLWGSVSFICLVVVAGWLFEVFGIVNSIEGFTLLLLALLLASTFRLPKVNPVADNKQTLIKIRDKLKQKPIQAFLICSFLLQMSFAAYYGFFSIYLQSLGYNGYQIGIMIALGVIAEIGIFLVSGKILNRFSLRSLFIFCLAITALRWFALGLFGEHLIVLLLIQLIHAFSYGLYHVSSQKFIHNEFPDQAQAKGQALYLSFSFGVGGAVGNFVSGYSWQYVQQQTYLLSGTFVFISVLIALCWLKPAKPRAN